MSTNLINNLVYQQLLDWFVKNQGNIGLGSVPQGILTSALNVILPTLVNRYTSDVFQQTNQSINNGPQELLGPVNPFNTVIGNQPSAGIAQAVLSRIGVSGLGNIQNNLISNLVQGLQTNLGPYGENINYQLVGTSMPAYMGSFFEKVTTEVSTSFIDGVIGNQFEAPNFLDSSSLELGVVDDPEEDLDNLDVEYTKTATKSFLQQSENFNIQNQDNLQRLEVTSKGFLDPTATFPTTEYAQGSEVNKLAQGMPENSLVQAKEKTRLKSAPLPGNQSFAEPPSAYKAEYPFNKVTETEQGHVIEIDDTPGAERLHIYHKAGTYIEVDSAGNMVVRRAGSDYQIIDKNGYVSVAGALNISVAGSVNLFAGNNANVEIIGDAAVTVHNDMVLQAAGNLNISAGEMLNLHGASVRIESDTEFDVVSDGIYRHRSNSYHAITNENFTVQAEKLNLNSNTTAALNMQGLDVKSNTYIRLQSAEDLNLKSGGVVNSQSSGNFNIKSGSGLRLQSTGQTSVKGGAAVNIDGSSVNILKGLSTVASGAVDAAAADLPESAKNSQAGLLNARKDFVAINIADSFSLGLADNLCIEAEETTDSPENQKILRDKLISKGLATSEQLDADPVEQSETESVSTNNKQVIAPSDFCLGLTEAPDSFKLSPNFTLGQLSSRAACSQNRIVPQAGLSHGQILQNLQAVALNICEPVLNLYPNMFVTSGFRLLGSNPTSQHPKGQAVDIQFKGLPAADYFKIANLLAQSLNYDQLLLEYSNYTKNPWIHISFSANNKNRNQVLTFWNNKTYANGLVKLA
jgi:hypothetical protein